MKKFMLIMIIFGVLGMACKENHASKNNRIKSELPQFSLKDPAGKTFTEKDFAEHGLVIVVTAPILSNQRAQEGWDKYLNASRKGNKGKLVFLEDMGPSAFKDKARKEMKKEYEAGAEPILLIDEAGQVRKKFGVAEKDTVVLVFNKDGKLVHKETQEPSAESAQRVWGALEK